MIGLRSVTCVPLIFKVSSVSYCVSGAKELNAVSLAENDVKTVNPCKNAKSVTGVPLQSSSCNALSVDRGDKSCASVLAMFNESSVELPRRNSVSVTGVSSRFSD